MSDEFEIDDYKSHFKDFLPNQNYQPVKGSRHTLLRGLRELHNKLKTDISLLEQSRPLPDKGKNLKATINELNQFIKENFSKGVFESFTSSDNGLSNHLLPFKGNAGLLLAITGEILHQHANGLARYEKIAYIEKFKKLDYAITNIENSGLHPKIYQRPQNLLRYNVVVKTTAPKDPFECVCSIDKEDLLNRFVYPYHNDEVIEINGRKIPKHKRVKLTITKTFLKPDELILYKSRAGITEDKIIAEKFPDITDAILTEFRSQKEHVAANNTNPAGLQDCINTIIKGIRRVQDSRERLGFVKRTKEGDRNETEYCEWFREWFEAAGYKAVIPEAIAGRKRIDLQVHEHGSSMRILEFKGWWNFDLKNVADQVLEYLSDFEGEAFIVIINSTKTDINEKYKSIITSAQKNYIPNSWKKLIYKDSAFSYYVSRHKGDHGIKNIYHFILNVK